jgi:hypothetical protein
MTMAESAIAFATNWHNNNKSLDCGDVRLPAERDYFRRQVMRALSRS